MGYEDIPISVEGSGSQSEMAMLDRYVTII